MKVTLALLLLLVADPVVAQWQHVTDFISPDGYSEYITRIYFLDLPGRPRIGFVGTESRLYKTTDGGQTWTQSWRPRSGRDYNLYFVTDVCFRDSLLGWFTMFGDTDACYRTTDGGNSWKQIYSAPFGAAGIHYCPENDRLFLALANDVNTGTRLSTDYGNTWKSVIDTPSGGWVFFSASRGVTSGSEKSSCDTCDLPYANHGVFLTSDSGSTWTFHLIPAPPQCLGFSAPLGFSNSPTCFLTTWGRFTVWRSDDSGGTWLKIADLGPYADSSGHSIGPYSMGCIKGDLLHLSIQTDSGMYVSVDSGRTWSNQGGPPCITAVSNDNFYSEKGVTFAGETHGDGILYSGGLWREKWPEADVSNLPDASQTGLMIRGPFLAPSEYTSDKVIVLVHSVNFGLEISAQEFDLFGSPLGQRYVFCSDGLDWNRIALPAPRASGTYFIRVNAGNESKTISYSVN